MLAAGCGEPGAEAPEILYGEDICDHCRMVISEPRHAAGARLDEQALRFDDPGCLREFLEARGPAPAAAWVHDENEAWLAVTDAWFVEDPEGGTPMASGILAFADPAAAAAAGERYGVEPWRWSAPAEQRASDPAAERPDRPRPTAR